MSLNFQQSRQLLQDFDFANLFIEVLGWSNPTKTTTSTSAAATQPANSPSKKRLITSKPSGVNR
jgi:hypothetical protein